MQHCRLQNLSFSKNHTEGELPVSLFPPILRSKEFTSPSVFTADNLLREARRQKSIPVSDVPDVCVLDPDGDILDILRAAGHAQQHPHWPCYHTDLYHYERDGLTSGLIGRAVGASFAVRLAEELFASGCQLLISITSAGQITRRGEPPYFVLIERALRDEGTSYHYLPPSDYANLQPHLRQTLLGAFDHLRRPIHRGDA
jgi:hypothetical protein